MLSNGKANSMWADRLAKATQQEKTGSGDDFEMAMPWEQFIVGQNRVTDKKVVELWEKLKKNPNAQSFLEANASLFLTHKSFNDESFDKVGGSAAMGMAALGSSSIVQSDGSGVFDQTDSSQGKRLVAKGAAEIVDKKTKKVHEVDSAITQLLEARASDIKQLKIAVSKEVTAYETAMKAFNDLQSKDDIVIRQEEIARERYNLLAAGVWEISTEELSKYEVTEANVGANGWLLAMFQGHG